MQAGQLTIDSPNVTKTNASSITENIAGWVTRLFGCWHREMSRPFSHQGNAYRVCLNCGAERRFNLRSWEAQGEFYYKLPRTGQLHALHEFAAVRRANV